MATAFEELRVLQDGEAVADEIWRIERICW